MGVGNSKAQWTLSQSHSYVASTDWSRAKIRLLRPFLLFILYSPFAFGKLTFPIFLIGDLHDIEFLQIVIVFYHADTAEAFENLGQDKYLWILEIDRMALRQTQCYFLNDCRAVKGRVISDPQFDFVRVFFCRVFTEKRRKDATTERLDFRNIRVEVPETGTRRNVYLVLVTPVFCTFRM